MLILIGLFERRQTQMSILAASTTPSVGLVVCMGVGMVFFGLICLIVICYLLGALVKRFGGKKTEAPAASAPKAAPVAAPIENRQELIAAISCVIAEELGTSVSAIRIKSIKKI